MTNLPHLNSGLLAIVAACCCAFAASAADKLVSLRGEVVDSATKKLVPTRLYIQRDDGAWFFPKSTATDGSALRYEKKNWLNTNVVEMHTTLSAHPFTVELPPGRYTITVERGKEYFPLTQEVVVGSQPVEVRLPLRRWIDMARRGWFSGDTHVHRAPADLPNVLLAEDVNVVFPMVYWTTDVDVPPSHSTKNFTGDFLAAPEPVDATHVFYPRNTEYEIFTTAKRSHTLGALLLINHQSIFDLPALPIGRVAERAHAEGALLDLEKHNWPWSMVIVPLVQPDLYELANNHLWRTDFAIKNWADPAPAWMRVGSGSATERDWANYGFLNYYALLDCGFRLQPTAGTANGVHPVPLGFGRVYVHLPRRFDYDAWVEGLKHGRSFVTTGPMLFATVNGRDAGHIFKSRAKANQRFRVKSEIVSATPTVSLEIVVNGEISRTHTPASKRTPAGAYEHRFDEIIDLDGSGWIAVRAWEERDQGRFRFAHTAPWHVEVENKPLRPRREEVEFLVQRVKDEIARSSALLPPSAVAEFRKALAIYEALAPTAR